MSIATKGYFLYKDIRNIFNRKSFKNIFLIFSTILLFFVSFNAFAADDDGLSADYKGERKFTNLSNKVSDGKQSNKATGNALEFQTTLHTWSLRVGGTSVLDEETRNEIEAAADIPNDLKRGLIGMTEDASTALYASYPIVDIPEHLAQQWVPGYNESITALYAENSVSGHPSGYDELKSSGIIPLWTRVLNLAYIFFVVVMIVAGFMIMFRHKLQGQTIVTLGSVLPKVIISLIVATFSFAIAGLIIDFGGILIGLVMYILDLSDAKSISGLGPLMGNILFGSGGLKTIISNVGASLGITGGIGFAGILAGTVLGGPMLLAGLGIVGLLMAFSILGIILFGAIKVLITLLKAYFMLLVNVVLGPIQITLGAIPGNSTAIINWLLSILRNVLVFPVVFFIVNLPNAILESGSDINLRFPGKLVFQDPVEYDAQGINVAGGFFIWILKIFVLFFAAQAPKFIEGFLPPKSSKGLGAGFDAARGSMEKIPLVGGLFKK